jgi:hypothetical protein
MLRRVLFKHELEAASNASLASTEGYEWYPLMGYGQNGMGMVRFSCCYSLVTGVRSPDEFV